MTDAFPKSPIPLQGLILSSSWKVRKFRFFWVVTPTNPPLPLGRPYFMSFCIDRLSLSLSRDRKLQFNGVRYLSIIGGTRSARTSWGYIRRSLHSQIMYDGYRPVITAGVIAAGATQRPWPIRTKGLSIVGSATCIASPRAILGCGQQIILPRPSEAASDP